MVLDMEERADGIEWRNVKYSLLMNEHVVFALVVRNMFFSEGVKFSFQQIRDRRWIGQKLMRIGTDH